MLNPRPAFSPPLLFNVTSHFQRPKNRFFFYLIRVNSNILPKVSIKKILRSLKAPELFRKTYFQTKVTISGRCHSLVQGRIPWRNFRGNRSFWASFFMLFAYFVYIALSVKFTRGSSLLREISLLMGESKAEESTC